MNELKVWESTIKFLEMNSCKILYIQSTSTKLVYIDYNDRLRAISRDSNSIIEHAGEQHIDI